MATAESVKAKLQNLLSEVNGVTGKSDTDLTSGIDSLIEVYRDTIPSGSLPIDANGSYDVTKYASVDVNVPIPEGYIQPSGSLPIYVNGTYDVTDKEEVVVDVYSPSGSVTSEAQTVTPTKSIQVVTPITADYLSSVTVNPIPDEYVFPTGRMNIVENGEYDVSSVQTVIVSVPTDFEEVEYYNGSYEVIA